MSVKQQLEDIYAAHGELTPKLLVDTARPDDHPLHDRFEWDNTVAGEKYREEQARGLIRTVRVVEVHGDTDVTSVRAFHSVPRPAGQTYVPLDEVIADPFTRTIVLKAAEREWRRVFSRNKHLAEFIDMVLRDLGEQQSA